MPGPRPSADDRRLQGLAVFFILLGLLLGPGYYGYCTYVSGQDTATVALTERSDRFVLADGSIQRFHSGLGFRPTALQLHPERNEVRLALRFHMPEGAAPAGATNRYLLTVFDAGYPVVQRELTFAARAGATEAVVLPAFAVRAPFDHLLVLEELGKPDFPADSVTVTVRERVAPVIVTYAYSGLAVMFVGLVLYWIGMRRR